MATGIITFRNPLWDALIEFVDQLKNYEGFETMDNGRLKNRLTGIYDRAVERMRIDKSDMDLLAKTFIYLNEKAVDSDLIEYMNENKELGYQCTTTREGEKIIKECESIVKQRKYEEEVRKEYAEAKAKYDEAQAKRQAYLDEQNRIMGDFESSSEKLNEMEELIKKLDSKEPEKVTAEAEVTNDK